MKKIFAALLVLMMVFTGAALAEDNSLQAVLDKGELILGLDSSFPPMGFEDENGNIVGFDIDLAKAVCDKLGIKLTPQPIDWAAKEMELNSGNIDCIWNGMSITPDREASMAMTWPYLNNGMVFYIKSDSAIASLEDLAGKKVAVQGGSTAEQMLDDDYADLAATFAEVVAFEEYLGALMDLQNGGCDAVLIDLVVGEYRANAMGATDIKAGPYLTDDLYGIGFRKDDIALRDKVQEVLIELKADGTLAEVCKLWFTEDVTTVP